jgi:hypothetical protein
MSQISIAAASPFGIAAFIFLALGIAGMFGLVGKGARVSLSVAGIGSFAILFVVAMMFPLPVPGSGDDTQVVQDQPTPTPIQTQEQTQERVPLDVRGALQLLAEAEEHSNLGRTEEARDAYGTALDLFRQAGNTESEALVLAALGDLEKKTLRFEKARAAYAEARKVFADARGTNGGHLLLGLEALATRPDGEEAARRDLAEAHLLYQQIEDPNGLAW